MTTTKRRSSQYCMRSKGDGIEDYGVWRWTGMHMLAPSFSKSLILSICLLWLASMGLEQAQIPSQIELQKLLASDDAAFDRFGDSVTLSDYRALVGASGNPLQENLDGDLHVNVSFVTIGNCCQGESGDQKPMQG